MSSSNQQSSRSLAPAGQNTAPPVGVVLPRKTIARSACYACKERKTKCIGDHPCDSCVKRGTQCVFNEDGDLRRRKAIKRKIENLEQDRDLLLHLVGTLREAGNRRVIQLLNLIRSNASLDEVRLYIDEQLGRDDLEHTPELEDVRTEIRRLAQSNVQSRRRVLDVNRLADTPVYNVPAKPWTRLSDDDSFVSHLVSLWFTWFHPTYNWIDRNLFIKDMQAGNLDCQYCSPFLVNIILADACAYSDYPEAYADLSDPSTRGTHFYEEAKRLYEREEGRINLSTVQGLGILWPCAFLLGRDRAGWIYQGQVAFTVHEFSSSHPPVKGDVDESERVMDRVRNNTIWGIYNLTTISSMTYQRPPLIKTPRRPQLPDSHWQSEQWVPYPLHGDKAESHISCVFNSSCSLNQITSDLTNTFFNEEGRLPRADIEQAADNLYERLKAWLASMPSCIARENAVTPHALNIHMNYQTIIMTIFGFLKKPSEDNKEATEDSARRAQGFCVSAALLTADLMNVYRSAWGLDRFPPSLMQWATVAIFTLLEQLDSPRNRDAFIQLCIVLRALSRRFVLAKGMLRLIQLTARNSQVSLPDETEGLFADFEAKAWESKDRERFSSNYPNFFASVNSEAGKQNEEIELDKFLARWDALDTLRENEED